MVVVIGFSPPGGVAPSQERELKSPNGCASRGARIVAPSQERELKWGDIALS